MHNNAIAAWEAVLLLIVISDTLGGRMGAVLSALIVIFCIVGLTMHKDFYAGVPRKDFFCFYTNLSNALVGVYFALIAPRLYTSRRLHPLIPHAEFLMMMSIMLTFSVFHLMLFPAIRSTVSHAARTREYQIVCTDNFIIHYLVPWLVFFYWLLCGPGKMTLGVFDAVLWTLLPALYLSFILLRAGRGKLIEETGSPYPYPFLDAAALGRKTVLRLCLSLYGICLAAGISAIALIRIAFALFGGGHALFLI